MPIIPALRWWRQEDQKLKVIISHLVSELLSLTKKEKQSLCNSSLKMKWIYRWYQEQSEMLWNVLDRSFPAAWSYLHGLSFPKERKASEQSQLSFSWWPLVQFWWIWFFFFHCCSVLLGSSSHLWKRLMRTFLKLRVTGWQTHSLLSESSQMLPCPLLSTTWVLFPLSLSLLHQAP